MFEALAGIALIVVIGLSIEFFRRGKLQSWVEQESGTFSAAGEVPEAAIFDSARNVSYRNIARFERRGVRYVVAERLYVRSDFKDTVSSSQVICVAVLPGQDLPGLLLGPARREAPPAIVQGMRSMMGAEARPASIPLPEALPAFTAAFDVRALAPALPTGAAVSAGASETEDKPAAVSDRHAPDAASVAAVLSPAVQTALLEHRDQFASVSLRGDIIRVQAMTQQLKRNHAQALAAAEAIVQALKP